MGGSQIQQSLATLQGLGLTNTPKDWDQLSMYSSRSIPRARMYHAERPGSINTRYFNCLSITIDYIKSIVVTNCERQCSRANRIGI